MNDNKFQINVVYGDSDAQGRREYSFSHWLSREQMSPSAKLILRADEVTALKKETIVIGDADRLCVPDLDAAAMAMIVRFLEMDKVHWRDCQFGRPLPAHTDFANLIQTCGGSPELAAFVETYVCEDACTSGSSFTTTTVVGLGGDASTTTRDDDDDDTTMNIHDQQGKHTAAVGSDSASSSSSSSVGICRLLLLARCSRYLALPFLTVLASAKLASLLRYRADLFSETSSSAVTSDASL